MKLLEIFSGPYALLAKWGVIALLAAALSAFWWVKGDIHGTEKLTEYQGKEAVQAVRIAGEREKIVYVTQVKYQDRINTVFTQGATITREVPVYVTKSDDAACVVPIGLVRQYNAGWSGEAPGSPAESDRGPSGVSLSTVAEVDAHNATSCRAYKEQRDGVIDFYRQQQRVR